MKNQDHAIPNLNKNMTLLPSPFLSLLPFFFFFFLLSIHLSSSQTLIHETCKTIAKQDPNVKLNFCTTSLQAAPGSCCASLKGLGMISLRLTRFNVTGTRCFIKQMLKNGKLDHDIRARLDDCLELYSDMAMPSAKMAMKYYSSKDYYEANVQISAVMDAALTCEDGFKEKKGLVSPLTKRNDDTFELSAVVLSIMHILQNGTIFS